MLWEERQKKVEKVAYKSLETIANELDVPIPFYPKVYWIGRKLKFEELNLPYKYKKEFNSVKKWKKGEYLFESKVILIGGYFLEDIGEEVGHFLHLNSSNISKISLKTVNDFCLYSIIEMFGFFCSKLIKPTRENNYKIYKDALSNCSKSEEFAEKEIKAFNRESDYEIFSEAYQQGYGLGEEIFKAYKSGSISKKNIRKLFTNPLNEKNEPLKVFLELKHNMVNFMKDYKE
jgi:hypothetical protein